MSIPAGATRRAAIVPVLLLIVAVLVVVRPAPAMAAPYMPFPNPGQQIGQFHLKNYHSGRCVDVPGGSMNENVGLHQWTCVRQTNEYWSFR